MQQLQVSAAIFGRRIRTLDQFAESGAVEVVDVREVICGLDHYRTSSGRPAIRSASRGYLGVTWEKGGAATTSTAWDRRISWTSCLSVSRYAVLARPTQVRSGPVNLDGLLRSGIHSCGG